MFSVAFVCLPVCLQHYSKSYERISMKFYGGVAVNGGVNGTSDLIWGSNPDHDPASAEVCTLQVRVI